MAIPRCPTCRHRLFQIAEDGTVKLRTNILLFKAGVATAKCPACKSDVPLDLQLGDDLRKSLVEPPRRLVLREVRNVRKSLDDEDCGT